MFKQDLKIILEKELKKSGAIPGKVEKLSSVGGGDINEAYQVITKHKNYFIKLNQQDRYPGMFETEKNGLELLMNKSGFKVPGPILTGEVPGYRFILMEWVEMQSHGDWHLFGSTLARMHTKTNSQFGLDHQNYIGSLFQDNTFEQTWSEFYINRRLHPLCKKAFDNGQLDRSTIRAFENLYQRLDEIYPSEPPALLHGDLWSGNRAYTSEGTPCIYDPAVYYGHREIDLAMTKLFGGFPEEMYRTYHQNYPLEPGWEERIPIGQLYPLLVHVILFGGGYANQVRSIVGKFA